MKNKLICLLPALLLLLGCCGCGLLDDDEETDGAAAETSAAEAAPASETPQPEARGLRMSVNRETGELTLTRPSLPERSAAGDRGVWTIFVYLCGTDLETDDGGATDDLLEMLEGANGDWVRFVVQTGGAEEWWNDTVDSSRLQRYLIENGELTLAEEQPAAGMGRGKTLSAFLRWGADRYASAHMGVVLWDHGGGSITGVCFDETDDYDSLSLRELDAALLDVCTAMGGKFDFIGFDACLMGTLETANILASYASYMIASQEIEPGSGWDYAAMGKYLAGHPGAAAADLGRAVCDSYLASCRTSGDEDVCTLSLIDLGKLDGVLTAFNDFARGMFEASADAAACADMVRAIQKTDNFGGNNKSEGYTNMVDMGGVISACAAYAQGAGPALEALKAAVAYSVSGKTHRDASGLSLYYPLSVQGSRELSVFGEICPSPYYVSFVDRQNQGSVSLDAAEDYDGDEWFDDDGNWFWDLLDAWLDDGDWTDGDWGDDDWTDDYWDYLDDYEQTGESPLITFAVEPHTDEDGVFWFELDDNGYCYAADVYGVVFQLSYDGEDLIELGETYDLNGDWDTGVFADDFDGWWISLPDGQNLATYIVEDGEDFTIYTSPVLLNGEETNLRLRLDYAYGTLTIEGAWDGIDAYGALSREIVKLRRGDVITPLYNAYALESDDEFYYQGEDYVFTDTPELCYDLMADGDYFFAFCIDDIYGDYCLSDFAVFSIEDGEVWFWDETF
jgi:hypothetical protein